MAATNKNDDIPVKTLAEARAFLLKNREKNRQQVKVFAEKLKQAQKSA